MLVAIDNDETDDEYSYCDVARHTLAFEPVESFICAEYWFFKRPLTKNLEEYCFTIIHPFDLLSSFRKKTKTLAKIKLELIQKVYRLHTVDRRSKRKRFGTEGKGP